MQTIRTIPWRVRNKIKVSKTNSWHKEPFTHTPIFHISTIRFTDKEFKLKNAPIQSPAPSPWIWKKSRARKQRVEDLKNDSVILPFSRFFPISPIHFTTAKFQLKKQSCSISPHPLKGGKFGVRKIRFGDLNNDSLVLRCSHVFNIHLINKECP